MHALPQLLHFHICSQPPTQPGHPNHPESQGRRLVARQRQAQATTAQNDQETKVQKFNISFETVNTIQRRATLRPID
jgi:hypothetical protein